MPGFIAKIGAMRSNAWIWLIVHRLARERLAYTW
jgi:hypothetical protein